MQSGAVFAGAFAIAMGVHGAAVGFIPLPVNDLPEGDGFGAPMPELNGQFEDLAEEPMSPEAVEPVSAEAAKPEITPQPQPEPVKAPQPVQPTAPTPQPDVEIPTPPQQVIETMSAVPMASAAEAIPVLPAVPVAMAPVEPVQMATPVEDKPFTIQTDNANLDAKSLEESFQIATDDDLLALQSLNDEEAILPDFETALNPPAPRPQQQASQRPRETAQTGGSSRPRAGQPRSGGRASGSAGGGGQGRGDPGAMAAHRAAVQRKIARAMRRVSGSGTAVVAFRVNRNGGLGSVSIVQSSGNSRLDNQILRAVRRAAPFPPPPNGRSRDFRQPLRAQ